MTKNQKSIHYSIYNKLNEKDSEFQTYGCRCYNPDICKNNGRETCAFFNKEHICTTPSKKWDTIYDILKEKLRLLSNNERGLFLDNQNIQKSVDIFVSRIGHYCYLCKISVQKCI